MARNVPERILYFGFRRPLNQQALQQALQASRPERVGLVSRSNFLDGVADQFLLAKDGFRGLGFESNPHRAFPSASFLKAMQRHEVVALRMYERAFRGVDDGQNYEVRKRLYMAQLVWAHGLLVDGGWTKLVLSEIPHHPFAYILHASARELGIDARFLQQLQVKDSFLVAGSVEGMFDPIRAAHARIVRSAEPVALEPRISRERERRLGRHQPFYMGVTDLPWRGKAYQWAKRNLRADDWLRVRRAFRNGWAYWRARKDLESMEEPFVYFPLHLQPEATTSPMGGVFVDQYLAVEVLARAVPSGWKVVVKENPAQRFAKRDYGFYEHLGRLPNIRLVSRSADTFNLIEKCAAVATITGTAGWEALFKGKPVLVFGNAFYRGAPGTVDAGEPDELASAMRKIDAGTFRACSVDELDQWLAAIQSCTREGVVDTQYLRDSDLSFDECVARLRDVLIELMEAQISNDPVG